MASLLELDNGLNFKATELRLGMPGTGSSDEAEEGLMGLISAKKNKRILPDHLAENKESNDNVVDTTAPAAKAQIVGWPPVRSFRKNSFKGKKTEVESSGIYVKVSMDGAPYLRKIDLKGYKGYKQLLKALEDMFKHKLGEYSEREGYKGSEHAPAYEDGDGDLMLVGDVPWEMFISSCKRLRIMKASEAKGLGFGV